MPGNIDGRLPKGRCTAAHKEHLACPDAQIAKETAPGRCVGFGDGSQGCPVQIGVESKDKARRHAGILGVTAISRATHPAHNGGHGLTSYQAPTRIVLHLSHAFDATDGCGLKPGACAHLGFRTIDAKGFDFDQDFAFLWSGCRDVSKYKLFWTTELVDDDCLH